MCRLLLGTMIKGVCETSHLVYKYVPLLKHVSVSYSCYCMTGSQVQSHGRPVERASRIERAREISKARVEKSCMKYIRYRKISTKLHHSENRVCVYLPVSVDRTPSGGPVRIHRAFETSAGHLSSPKWPQIHFQFIHK